MPVDPYVFSGGGGVDAASIYLNLFGPVNPPTTPEAVNGGLDESFWAAGDNSIPMWAVQTGAFAAAYWLPETRMQAIFAGSFLSSTRGKQYFGERACVPGIGARFFLPWEAGKGVLYAVQVFWQHDATQWDSDDGFHNQNPEHWDVRIYGDRSEDTAVYSRLGPTRTSAGRPDGSGGSGYVDPGMSDENRWRHTTIISGFESGNAMCQKGSHILQLSLWPNVFAPDNTRAKAVSAVASIGVLAFR